MYPQPAKAYELMAQATVSGRELEASVLTRAALLLKGCRDDWEAQDHGDRLAAALEFNQRVWTFFQTELTDAANALPHELKLNLVRLGAFVDRRIFEIMAAPSPEKLTAIIDINLGVAAGLRSSPAERRVA